MWRSGGASRRRSEGLAAAQAAPERRSSGERRDDVLSMLLDARREDGSEMSRQEIRDELMTALVAGHETTASELAWVFERLAREPRVLKRLREDVDSANGDDYLTATIRDAPPPPRASASHTGPRAGQNSPRPAASASNPTARRKAAS